jgi:hypothetical protein
MILLDASDTGRRLLQQGLVLAGMALVVSGLVMIAMALGRWRGLGLAALAAGPLFVFASSRVLVRWEVLYGGHVIRFENSVVFGERLIIDGERFTEGMLGYRKVIEGAIRRGSHAGERVRAESEAGLVRFRCKLTIETA